MADMPNQQSTEASVNVINPDNELVSIPASQLNEAQEAGYTKASPEDVNNYVKQQKYGTPSQQAITALEGAGEGATFGLSTGLERMAGVNPEDIQGRREANPNAHMLGQVGGLAASALIPGVGEANVISKAGAGAAEALGLGLEGAGTLSKIGSAAVKASVENMLVQGGDEVSKMLSSDPNQSVQTALTNIGLTGLIGAGVGGALGSINPLWKASMSGKVGKILNAITDRLGGNDSIIPDEVNEAIQTAGLDVSPEVKSGLSNDPTYRDMFAALQESATSSGEKAQEALKDFKNNVSQKIVESLGKTPEDLEGLANMSANEIGDNAKQSLINTLKLKIDPISEEFEKLHGQYEGIDLVPSTKDKIAEQIGKMAEAEGYNLSPSSDQFKAISRVLEEIQNLKTVSDLTKYQTIVRDSTSSPEMYRVGKQLINILRDAETDTVTSAAVKDGFYTAGKHQYLRQAYKNAMDLIDTLNDRLHVGKYGGPDSFIRALKDMSPEDVIRRLSGKGDADLLELLSKQFPETANQVKDFHIQSLLKTAVNKAGDGQLMNNKAFFSNLERLTNNSPELKQFILGNSADKIGAISSLLDQIPERMGPSGSPKTIDHLWRKIPGTAVGMATMLAGHNPVIGMLAGALTNTVNRDAPDAIRLGLLKFLGSDQPLEAEGFKAMTDFIQHTIKGENLVSKATQNIFKAGAEVLPQSLMPDEKDRSKLDAKLKELQEDSSPLFDVGGKTTHYLPEHGVALGQTTSNAVSYLNSLRPVVAKKNPLDTDVKPDPIAQAQYNKALNIAQQPLIVMNHIKDGRLTSQDVVTLKTLYPSLYDRMSKKILVNMSDAVSKGVTIPYKTRIGLSLFLGQPLDSTLTPSAIQSTQPTQPTMLAQAIKPKHSMQQLSKLSSIESTPAQSRELARTKIN